MRARPRNSEAKPFDMLHTASRKPTIATPLLGSVRMSMIVVPISPPAAPRVFSTNSTISARTSSAACFPMSTSNQPRTAVTASAAGTMLRTVQNVTPAAMSWMAWRL